MKFAPRVLLFASLAFAGCETARDVAVTGWRVIDAPANYVRRHIDRREPTTTTTTTTTASSDQVAGGRPVDVNEGRQTTTTQARPTARPHASATPANHTARSDSTQTNHATSSATPRSSTGSRAAGSGQTSQYPTARPVPGKPGYVYSLDANGGYVDVSGYKSGDKAKDPYTQKVFIVP